MESPNQWVTLIRQSSRRTGTSQISEDCTNNIRGSHKRWNSPWLTKIWSKIKSKLCSRNKWRNNHFHPVKQKLQLYSTLVHNVVLSDKGSFINDVMLTSLKRLFYKKRSMLISRPLNLNKVAVWFSNVFGIWILPIQSLKSTTMPGRKRLQLDMFDRYYVKDSSYTF